MAQKKEETVVVSIPRRNGEKSNVRVYSVNGTNYTVPIGQPISVPKMLYDAIVISGDLDNRG